MSDIEHIKAAIRKLDEAALRALVDWLTAHIEDTLEFTDEFKAAIAEGKRDLAQGKGRYRTYHDNETR